MRKNFTIEIEKDGKFYIAQCREHSNCFTQGKTIEEAIRNIKEVIELILEVKTPELNVILKKELINTL
ncbi:type II toxin-antitoxin system HicB family antitoxin [Candidatus Kuenenia sp.]|uniref:type II toxin-antitoxin system HicB family antitoxin n=1 Tax=Candidatus Kuenenia sp. TaxID=2499824 RepID=UPI00321F8D03